MFRLLTPMLERLSWRDFEAQVRASCPDVLGLTIMTPMLDVAQRTFRLLRPYARFTMAGGPHPTAVKHAIFKEIPNSMPLLLAKEKEVAVDLVQWFEEDTWSHTFWCLCARH